MNINNLLPLSSAYCSGVNVGIYYPRADPAKVKHEYAWNSVKELGEYKGYDVVVLSVAHNEFKHINIDALCKDNKMVYDVKGSLGIINVDGKL